ncbi:MAG: DNA repair protein RecO [Chitinophagaceae bacterium]|nr:DNA repair protein RecO [Chitinophagaceae bacterium]
MISSTRGIVLRNVKYGESSIVATVYTRMYGLQSYMINGIRTSKRSATAYLYQPASILDMQVYHNDLKNLQRVKEAAWGIVYNDILRNVIKNTVALFIVELIQKTIRHEEQNEEFYDFVENTLKFLDECTGTEAADIPVFFAVCLPDFLGIKLVNNFSETEPYFSPEDGQFIEELRDRSMAGSPEIHKYFSNLIEASHAFRPGSKGFIMPRLGLNGSARRKILYLIEAYFRWQIQGFSELKTLRVFEQMA